MVRAVVSTVVVVVRGRRSVVMTAVSAQTSVTTAEHREEQAAPRVVVVIGRRNEGVGHRVKVDVVPSTVMMMVVAATVAAHERRTVLVVAVVSKGSSSAAGERACVRREGIEVAVSTGQIRVRDWRQGKVPRIGCRGDEAGCDGDGGGGGVAHLGFWGHRPYQAMGSSMRPKRQSYFRNCRGAPTRPRYRPRRGREEGRGGRGGRGGHRGRGGGDVPTACACHHVHDRVLLGGDGGGGGVRGDERCGGPS
ncbi:hypothetical protein FA10DRAFT_267958 [Acaromyces ingoldii]|uniref:Uncharacterized protein n=1 Tax=Acaromyces ingoldii TaxID=215250 RepID=A0A316YL61_9BASI|nr:hypothetical protein FA10DRAFT_267958 [Acaromyces ingoldii]PWN89388.1 hypothetical protein FA10DRAFT_267958 [Acaromyces ingoldii]